MQAWPCLLLPRLGSGFGRRRLFVNCNFGGHFWWQSLLDGEAIDDLGQRPSMALLLDHFLGEGLLERGAWVSQRGRSAPEHEVWRTIGAFCDAHAARFAELLSLGRFVEAQNVGKKAHAAISHLDLAPMAELHRRHGVVPQVVELNLGHTCHCVGHSIRCDEAEELSVVVLSDCDVAGASQRSVTVVGVGDQVVQLQGSLISRVEVYVGPLVGERRGFGHDELVVQMHEDLVRSKFGLVGAGSAAMGQFVVELHERQQRLVELLAFVVGDKFCVADARPRQLVESMDMELGDELVAINRDLQVGLLEAFHVLQRKVVSDAPGSVPDEGVDLGQGLLASDDLVDQVLQRVLGR